MLQPGGAQRGEVKKAHATGRYGRNTQDNLYQKLSDDTSTSVAVAEEMDRRSSGPASEDEVMQFYIEDVARNIAEVALTRVFEKWPICCCKCLMGEIVEGLEKDISNLSHGTWSPAVAHVAARGSTPLHPAYLTSRRRRATIRSQWR